MVRIFLFVALLMGTALSSSVAQETVSPREERVWQLPTQDRLTYFELRPLMQPSQQDEFLKLADSKARAAWIERFWMMLDPTPTTDKNERRIEHDKRVVMARKQYPWKTEAGWDSRAEVMIRYGPPAKLIPVEADVTVSSFTQAGEIWVYGSPSMAFHFFANLDGHYVNTPRPVEWHDKGPSRFVPPADPDYDATSTGNPTTDMQIFKQRSDQVEIVKNEIETYAAVNPFIHACDVEDRLKLYFDFNTYQGGDRSPCTNVNFEVPSEELRFVDDGEERVAAVELKVLVRDNEFNKVKSLNDRIEATIPKDSPQPTMLLPGQISLSLEPGFYHVGIEACDTKTKKKGGFIADILVPSRPSALSLSDIQLASAINDAEDRTRFIRGDLQIVPHPMHAYRVPFPLSCYFEIYGLDTDESGAAFYRIEYTIVRVSKVSLDSKTLEGEGTITSSFETKGQGATQIQHAAIETNELFGGAYRLDVKVTDRRTLSTATKSRNFSILK